MTDTEIRLLKCFPKSFINHNGEFIANEKTNTYFSLVDCKNDLDIKCKVLEWISRTASKGMPYRSDKSNIAYRRFMLYGINLFLEQDFDENDIEVIYTYLGNAINHNLTVKFVESGYDMSILDESTRRANQWT